MVCNDLGKWDETRSLVNWTWTYNDIPTSATVTSVRIRFRAHNYDYNTFQFTMNNINHIWGDNNFNYYDAFNSTNQVYTTSITENPDGYAYFDVTFATGSPFCNAVNNAVQSAQYFFTLGIKITGSYQPPSYWYLSDYSGNGFDDHPAIDLQINYSTTLQTYHFFNNIEGTTNSGSINAKNDQTGTTSTYSSGSPASLDPRYIYSVTTNVLPFSANWNGSGYTEKDQYWNVNSNPTYVLTYDLQPDLDYIDGNLYSKFDKTYPATITTNIDGIVGGTVQLKDPWYYYSDGQGNWYQTNQFNSYSAPLSIQNSTGSYGGVFLNQPYNVIGKPYYSINFPSSQSISVGGTNHALYFLNWNATNATLQNSNSAQTPINFTGTGATATANVKGTQLSNDATAC